MMQKFNSVTSPTTVADGDATARRRQRRRNARTILPLAPASVLSILLCILFTFSALMIVVIASSSSSTPSSFSVSNPSVASSGSSINSNSTSSQSSSAILTTPKDDNDQDDATAVVTNTDNKRRKKRRRKRKGSISGGTNTENDGIVSTTTTGADSVSDEKVNVDDDVNAVDTMTTNEAENVDEIVSTAENSEIDDDEDLKNACVDSDVVVNNVEHEEVSNEEEEEEEEATNDAENVDENVTTAENKEIDDDGEDLKKACVDSDVVADDVQHEEISNKEEEEQEGVSNDANKVLEENVEKRRKKRRRKRKRSNSGDTNTENDEIASITATGADSVSDEKVNVDDDVNTVDTVTTNDAENVDENVGTAENSEINDDGEDLKNVCVDSDNVVDNVQHVEVSEDEEEEEKEQEGVSNDANNASEESDEDIEEEEEGMGDILEYKGSTHDTLEIETEEEDDSSDHDDDKTDKNNNLLSISCVTWNLAESSPSEVEASFLKSLRNSDLICISGQECENIKPRRSEGRRSRELRRLMVKHLGKKFVPIALHSLGGIQLGLFARRDTILADVEYVKVADVACGIGNAFHNKGAIGAFVRVKTRSNGESSGGGEEDDMKLLFVSAHLAAHVRKVHERNADYWRIAAELEVQAPPRFLPRRRKRRVSEDGDGAWGLPAATAITGGGGTLSSSKNRQPQPPSVGGNGSGSSSNTIEGGGSLLMESMDQVFFCGDLNYRIDLPREETEHAVTRLAASMEKDRDDDIHLIPTTADKIFLHLLRHDQLLAAISAGHAFPNFCEGKITFLPTFKFNKASLENEYDSGPKQRVLAWTDRILFKSNAGVKVLEYKSVMDAIHSDHRPVFAKFQVVMAHKNAAAGRSIKIDANVQRKADEKVVKRQKRRRKRKR